MSAVREGSPAISVDTAVRAAWQVVGVREDTVIPYFANAFDTRRLSVGKVRPDVWAWFPAVDDGGLFPGPLTVSKIGVPTRDPHRYAQSFRRMVQKYRRTYTYVEVEVRDTGTDEHLFLYWFDPSLEVCWTQYGLHQTVRTMILYRRAGDGTPDDKDLWRFRARLSKTVTEHTQHEFTSVSWRFGETTDTMDIESARQLQAGATLVERYPFCLQDDPLIGEPVWSNGYAWLPVTYGMDVAWERPHRQAVAFLQKIGAQRWPALLACVQDQYLEDLVRLEHLDPDLKEAVQGLHQAQYFDGKESIDQFLMGMDPELLDASEHERLFQLHVPMEHDSYVQIFIKETLDVQQGHVIGVYRRREDAEADQRPYVTFPTVGNWLRRIEHEIKMGLNGAWLNDEHCQQGSDVSLTAPVETVEHPRTCVMPWPSRHVVFERVSHMIPSCQIRWVRPNLINGFIVNLVVSSPQVKKVNSRLLGQRLPFALAPSEYANALPDVSAKQAYLRQVKDTNEGAYIRYEWAEGFAEYVLFVKPVPLPNGRHLHGMYTHDRQEVRPLFQFPTIGSKRPDIKTKQPPYTLTLEKLRSFAPGEATRFIKPLERTYDARFLPLPGADWNVLSNFEGMIIAAVRPYAHEWRKSIYQIGTIGLIEHSPRHWPTVMGILEGKTVLSIGTSADIDEMIQQESATPQPTLGTRLYSSCYSGPCSFVFAEDEGFIFCFVDDETLVAPVPDRYLSLVDWIGAGHAVLTPTQVQAREILRRRKLSKEEKVGLPDVDILGTVSHRGSQKAMSQQFAQAIAEHFEGCAASEVNAS